MIGLHGIMPVLQIPFDNNAEISSIDVASLRREVDFCIAAGASGLVVPALASEFMVLTDDERRRVVEVVVEQTSGRIPVIANVAATSVNAAVDFARHARTIGATALMALPPYLRKPTADGVVAYYAAIAAESGLPLIIQNAPPPFGVNLPTSLVLRIVDSIDVPSYIKEERLPPGHHISDVLRHASDRLHGVFGGSAGLYLPGELDRGAVGCMPSAALTDVLVAVYDAHRIGAIDDARTLHTAVLPLLTMEMSVMMAVSKDVLRRRGVFVSTTMRDPEFPALDEGDLAEIDALWPTVSRLFTVQEGGR
jgi:dihydrodipicolinate synthase/N-acetylneuraminate lyase